MLYRCWLQNQILWGLNFINCLVFTRNTFQSTHQDNPKNGNKFNERWNTSCESQVAMEKLIYTWINKLLCRNIKKWKHISLKLMRHQVNVLMYTCNHLKRKIREWKNTHVQISNLGKSTDPKQCWFIISFMKIHKSSTCFLMSEIWEKWETSNNILLLHNILSKGMSSNYFFLHRILHSKSSSMVLFRHFIFVAAPQSRTKYYLLKENTTQGNVL